MIKVDNKVKNIYYMLCYTFNKDLLKDIDTSDVSTESFENIYNLFAVILCLMLKKQVKKGMHKEYIANEEEISTVKGKINIKETISKNSLIKQKLICEFDEFSINNIFNRIIKTTANYLINSNKIGKQTKFELKKEMVHFSEVSFIGIREINWNTLRFNRNNNSYKNILLICKLILNGLIVTDSNGKEKFREFMDSTVIEKIYENFLKEYYRKEHNFKASGRILRLTDDDDTESDTLFIPTMRTDITLEYDNRMLIIDAKFYDKILQDGYMSGSKIISPDNIMQILAYVDNQKLKLGIEVYGMLLYAQTVDEPVIDTKGRYNRKTIMIKTIDLNKDWSEIMKTLECIAKDFKENNFIKEA